MFGYVLPLREELKVRDWEHFRAVYCGLCHTMGRRYGPFARLLLNYDFTFLALLLGAEEEARCRRCISGPCGGRMATKPCVALDIAADESVILAWWKFQDQVSDSSFWRGLPARFLARFYRRAYRRAARNRPAFDETVKQSLAALRALERANAASLDKPADAFATLLSQAAPSSGDRGRDRVLQQLLYHVGRWIYLVDAWDDLREDLRDNRYNPFVARYQLKALPAEGDSLVRETEMTLKHSLSLAFLALQLLPDGRNRPILENILCGGLPLVQKLVLSGRWKDQKTRLRGRRQLFL